MRRGGGSYPSGVVPFTSSLVFSYAQPEKIINVLMNKSKRMNSDSQKNKKNVLMKGMLFEASISFSNLKC